MLKTYLCLLLLAASASCELKGHQNAKEVLLDLASQAFDLGRLKELAYESEKSGLPVLGAWEWIPAQMPARITLGGEAHWEGPCFESLNATLEGNETGGVLTIHASGRKNHICSEFYDFGSRETINLASILINGKHTVKFSSWKKNEWKDVQQNGMKAFLFPGNEAQVAASVLKTLAFIKEDDMYFIQDKLQWQAAERTAGHLIFNKTSIRSGDTFLIFHSDATSAMIMWGTGGRISHSTVALWMDGECYIVESEGGSGIKKTQFDHWIAGHKESPVVILRLRDEYYEHFDEAAASEWFKSVEGSPYGYSNFIFSFLDTPLNNLPRPVTPALMEQAFSYYERMFGDCSAHDICIYNVLIQGLNHRLNSDCTTLQCIYDIIDPQNLSLFQVIAEPEQDEWEYTGMGCPWDSCIQRVCDSFVVSLYQNAGLPLPKLQATEQTPRDLNMMDIFEPFHYFSEECFRAGPALPYCQYSGDIILQLPGFNSIEPYENMNDHCPSVGPVYMRHPSNC